MTEEDRFKSIEQTIGSLTRQVAELDKLVTKLVLSLDAHTRSEMDMESTIKNIDSNVNNLMVKMASGPMERHKEVQELIDPIWSTLRKHDDRFITAGDQVKVDLRTEARSHLIVIWAFLAIIGGLSSYIYVTGKTEILQDIQQNKKYIEMRTDRIERMVSKEHK